MYVCYVCSRIADVCFYTWSGRIPDAFILLHLGSGDSDSSPSVYAASDLSTKPSLLSILKMFSYRLKSKG